jgi:hypothetical protein
MFYNNLDKNLDINLEDDDRTQLPEIPERSERSERAERTEQNERRQDKTDRIDGREVQNEREIQNGRDGRKLKYDWIENDWVENRIHEDRLHENKRIRENRIHENDTAGKSSDNYSRRRRRRKSRFGPVENIFNIPTEKVHENDVQTVWKKNKLEEIVQEAVDNRYTVGLPQVFISLL